MLENSLVKKLIAIKQKKIEKAEQIKVQQKTNSIVEKETNKKEIVKENIEEKAIEVKTKDIQKDKQLISLPDISVMITTHNRTNVICAVIDSLCKNLKYSGNIHWIISDDRSDNGHLEKVKKQLLLNEIEENYISILKTDKKRYGLGASLNNGLKEAFKYGEVVLTTEDDWILHKELILDSFVKTILNNSIAAIRLACLRGGRPMVDKKYKDFFIVKEYNDLPNNYIFNNQVALRHKRIYDKIGFYEESTDNNYPEYEMSKRFNRIIKPNSSSDYSVLFPREIKIRTIDHPSLFFIHVGKSTIGNTEIIPERYEYLYKPMSIQTISERRKISKKNLYIVSNQLDSNVNEPKDSYTFFKYLQKNDIPSVYLISSKHKFAKKIQEEKDVILLNNPLDKNEFIEKCSDALIHCKAYISEGTACNTDIFRFFQISTIKTIFMQHGIINNWESKVLANLCSKYKFINVSSNTEKETVSAMLEKYGYKKPRFIIAGLPRFDLLNEKNDKENKSLMVMFSCRPSLTKNIADFSKSMYFKNLLSIISKLDNYVLEKKLNKVFLCIHHQFVNRIPAMLDSFKQFKNIEIVNSDNISESIYKSSMLLTDISSVSFDFFFLKKPVIFWTLDKDDNVLDLLDKEKIHSSSERISKTLFNLFDNEEDVIKTIDFYINNEFVLEEQNVEKTKKKKKNRTNICDALYTELEIA